MAMSGTYLGIAAEAFDIARDHIKARTQGHTGEALAGNDLIQAQVADLWIESKEPGSFSTMPPSLATINTPRPAKPS